MKKATKGILAIAIVGMGVFASQAMADGVSGVPGSADDPVVTKSYVDQQIQKALGGGAGTGGASVSTGLTVVELHPGQTLYGFEGTEFIVRTGKVQAVAGDKGDGLTDITEGKDLRAGAQVAANHLLLIARSDNRGLRLNANYNGVAHIMVRGKYELR
ncbi:MULTISPECIES: hypothetical protein [Brevibacillus]|jgi:hypothetical protein|uniref:Uncharacterized protein n=1 Tax=Brevibacillus borstelensis AK1 TaxID=1300222 RepID=M8DZ08_9BACL|nr:hypothetical protein [Brevibacillus borstelensis]EMT52271.1 hypothetical protein I532_11479 [Brevibacillus borstelensis AK1]KKX54717.1 hypothetical protein X546_12930 [Brevibacillus borstelensis cifa_chp40]MBE5398316.1 hypothetical protein [Brevibacillus borstelensis]MCC0567069.1 hypothetical protein [Brevibacillus borstelensis]MCM3471014.1 hypothetical protein [Brevibacillus borstelensis]